MRDRATLTPLTDGLIAMEQARTPGWRLLCVVDHSETGGGDWYHARVIRDDPFCMIAARAERTRIEAIKTAFKRAREHA